METEEYQPIERRAGFPACRFTGLFSPVSPETGDWKVARNGRLESLPYMDRWRSTSEIR
jgi:hypothetical protein